MEYTFIELVRMAARESGTVADALPQSVSGQTGRIGKIVRWVDESWNQIQNSHAHWRWLHDSFEGDLNPGLRQYSPLQMGISRFAHWVTLPYTTSIYEDELGKSDEGFIYPIEYWRYRRFYDIGEQEPARPACFCASPLNLLSFGPAPDKVYHVRGEYYKSSQRLVNDNDLPELPLRFRPMIAWLAVILLSKHDEGGFAVAAAQQNYNDYMDKLEVDQLQEVNFYSRLV